MPGAASRVRGVETVTESRRGSRSAAQPACLLGHGGEVGEPGSPVEAQQYALLPTVERALNT